LQGEEYTATARAIRAGDLDQAPLPQAERLLLDFIGTLTRHAYRITDRQVQGLRDVGWTDPQIAEAVYVGALFSLFVRLADAFDIHPPALYDSDGGVPSVVGQEAATD
jgi:alkylhydroperoxidase family enzyme